MTRPIHEVIRGHGLKDIPTIEKPFDFALWIIRLGLDIETDESLSNEIRATLDHYYGVLRTGIPSVMSQKTKKTELIGEMLYAATILGALYPTTPRQALALIKILDAQRSAIATAGRQNETLQRLVEEATLREWKEYPELTGRNYKTAGVILPKLAPSLIALGLIADTSKLSTLQARKAEARAIDLLAKRIKKITRQPLKSAGNGKPMTNGRRGKF